MIRVDAYAYVPYMGQRQMIKKKKKENKGFAKILEQEEEKMGYKLDLTREELLMVMDAMDERKKALRLAVKAYGFGERKNRKNLSKAGHDGRGSCCKIPGSAGKMARR